MNDPHFAMSIYEEAGDVYFKGHRNRMASVPFYRDGSLPFARSIKDIHSEFRLLSKLTELLMNHGEQEEALQYATLAVQIANKTGVCVNERTAYHRLATIYYNLQQYEMAENYYLKSLSLCSPVLQHPKEARYFTKVYCRLGNLTLHKLKDAFDALGYFQLALAAALEDQANPEALYVVYMKLAEIHGNHMPDDELCQVYRDRAHSLKRVLAGVESSAAGDERTDGANSEPGQKKEDSLVSDMGCEESLVEGNVFDSITEDEKCEDKSAPRTLSIYSASEDRCADMSLQHVNKQKDHSHCLPDTDAHYVDMFGSETDTTASRSYSDSILTESFDTAKENISDSSCSTDTYQNPADAKDSEFDSDRSMPSQIPVKHTSNFTEHTVTGETDSDIQDGQNTPTKETGTHADLTLKESDIDKRETGRNRAEAASEENAHSYTEEMKSETHKHTLTDTNT